MSAACCCAGTAVPASFRFACQTDRRIAGSPPRREKRPNEEDAEFSWRSRQSCSGSGMYYFLPQTYDNGILKGFYVNVQFMNAGYGGRAVREDQGLARLKEIAELQPDWNGYGAKAFSERLIQMCGDILRALPAPPEIFPTARQSIQFQYELEDRSYLEFEIFETRVVCLRVPKREYASAVEQEFPAGETDRIKEIVSNFYGQHGEKR